MAWAGLALSYHTTPPLLDPVSQRICGLAFVYFLFALQLANRVEENTVYDKRLVFFLGQRTATRLNQPLALTYKRQPQILALYPNLI
jgi:hypothetical protein